MAGGLIWHEPLGLVYGAYWGAIVRLAIGHQVIWAVNSVAHAFGGRPHKTGDRSTNNIWLSVVSFVESWHNNHHAFATSARFGRKWFEVDIGWSKILALQAFNLVKVVRA